MKRRFAFLLLAVPFALVLLGAARPGPMYIPGPIAVPGNPTLEEISSAVRRGIMRRGWKVESERKTSDGAPAGFRATLNVRVHSVTIDISFDKEKIQIEYVDSTNMRYKETSKGKLIHPKYRTWIVNIERDISNELLALE